MRSSADHKTPGPDEARTRGSVAVSRSPYQLDNRLAEKSTVIAVTRNRDRSHRMRVRESLAVGCHRLEGHLVTDNESRALGLHDLTFFQIGKQPGHRFARGANHLGDF